MVSVEMDYKGIETLYTVHEVQSFEAAAKKLHITQSAVSQRIKNLEIQYGEPVLIRTIPYRPTELGKQLIGHFKRIRLLEETFAQQIGDARAKAHISIALNQDSLETWFLELLGEADLFDNMTLEIIADDQGRTLEHLKNGLVSACLSISAKEIIGGNIAFLGNMKYILVASPEFIKKYFSGARSYEQLLNAPAINFDQNDTLHARYLEKFFHLNGKDLNYHILPSVRGFKKFILLGHGYGLIPQIDVIEELKNGKLVQLYEDKIWTIPLYWHYWTIDSEFYQKFNADIIRYARAKLSVS